MTLRSLFSGVSGLRGLQTAIDVIGNNIANVNTTGFKAGRVTFADLFSQTVSGAAGAAAGRGGINPKQIGLGTRVASVDNIFTQGSLQTTGRLLDLAIQGNGFFALTDGKGGQFYTRAGNFSLDEQGFITNPANGYRLMGLLADESGTINTATTPSSIKIDFGQQVPAAVTTLATFGGNLSTNTVPRTATGLSTLTGLFDSQGRALNLRAGEVIEFEAGIWQDISLTVSGPTVNLAGLDILTITESSNLLDLQAALEDALRAATGSTTLQVNMSNGAFTIITGSGEQIADLRVNVAGPRNNRVLADIFTDADLTQRDIDIGANSSATTRAFRQADVTTSIDAYDRQGNPRTVTTAFARDTSRTPAAAGTLLTALTTSFGDAVGLLDGDIITFLGGTVGATDVTSTATFNFRLTVSAGTTLEELRLAIENALKVSDSAITVTVNNDGSLAINTGTDAIADLRVGTVGGNAQLASIFDNTAEGAGGGIDVAANSTASSYGIGGGNPLRNVWNWQAIVPHTAIDLPSNDAGRLIFDSNGLFQMYGDGTTGNPILVFDPDDLDRENGGVDALAIELDFSRLTQNAAANTAALESQNGSAVGELDTITIDPDGVIRGIFSNGVTRDIAQVLLASVANEGGLLKVGDTLFIESAYSGLQVLGMANTRGRGAIANGTLELSNVDLAQEFTNLIINQRAFQANSRIITTGDQILNEIVNLIR
ncbi:flagellar hook-basal body complex protein [bacterium]|nr:flagellar hook-basal body complex protein [bacterium]